MIPDATNPEEGASGSGKISSLLGSENTPDSKDQPHKNQEKKSLTRLDRAKLEQTRDLLHEALGFALIYAHVAQTLVEIEDDLGTLMALGNFHAAASAACHAARLIREARS
jgi:hypothetical protein